MSRPKPIVPRCFGLVYDIETEECQQCLAQDRCKHVNDGLPIDPRPKSNLVREMPVVIPKSKNYRILAVCKKFGIKPIIRCRDGEVEVTKQALDFWGSQTDVSGLLVNNEALEILLTTPLLPEPTDTKEKEDAEEDRSAGEGSEGSD